MPSSAYLTISELAARYGVTFQTLRFYEARGLLVPARIGTARLYTERDRLRLELVLKGKRLGFSLTEIETLIGASAAGEKQDGLLSSLDNKIACRMEGVEREQDKVETTPTELRAAIAGRPTELDVEPAKAHKISRPAKARLSRSEDGNRPD